jgi:hypothetical protein
MVASRQAQLGALDAHMLISGLTEDGSCNVPSRTTRNCGLADELAKRWQPQFAQKWRDIWFPLSAWLVKQLISPVTSIAALGKIAFAVPLPEIFWQTRHQQILAMSGSPIILYSTAPQRQLPRRSGMVFSSVNGWSCCSCYDSIVAHRL